MKRGGEGKRREEKRREGKGSEGKGREGKGRKMRRGGEGIQKMTGKRRGDRKKKSSGRKEDDIQNGRDCVIIVIQCVMIPVILKNHNYGIQFYMTFCCCCLLFGSSRFKCTASRGSRGRPHTSSTEARPIASRGHSKDPEAHEIYIHSLTAKI